MGGSPKEQLLFGVKKQGLTWWIQMAERHTGHLEGVRDRVVE